MTDVATGADHVLRRTIRYEPLDLSQYWNNCAVTRADATGGGALNVWRNSLPAEHLPQPGALFSVAGVPFLFPAGTPAGDNVRCAGQYLPVPAGRYDWLRVVATGERRVEETVALHFGDGQVDFEAIRISDFWAAPAWFGETTACRTPVMHYPHHVQPQLPATLWSQRVPVTRGAQPLIGVRLPRNTALHLFALTLEADAGGLTGLTS